MPDDLADFALPIRSLLEAQAVGGPMALRPAAPKECAELDRLRALSLDELFDSAPVARQDYAECVRAGLYLRFGALDDSHRVSQGIATSSGSYWHGIMHRQEGDWSNAKYWFRRVGEHPVHADLERETAAAWDPFRFVDECGAASAPGRDGSEAAHLQMLEWRLLTLHCYRRALGG